MAADLHRLLRALAGYEHDVAGLAERKRFVYPFAAVGDDEQIVIDLFAVRYRGVGDVFEDRLRVVFIRIDIGDDDEVGERGAEFAHDRPLVLVASAALGADRNDDLAARLFASFAPS